MPRGMNGRLITTKLTLLVQYRPRRQIPKPNWRPVDVNSSVRQVDEVGRLKNEERKVWADGEDAYGDRMG